jgi:hypothetical protein
MLDHTQEKYYIIHITHKTYTFIQKILQNYQNQLIFKLIVWAHKCIVDFIQWFQIASLTVDVQVMISSKYVHSSKW